MYMACMQITGNESNGNFLGRPGHFYHGMFLGSCLVYKALLGQGEHVSEKGRGSFFDMLGQEKEQVRAYTELSSERQSFDKTKALLNMVGEDMQQNVVTNVRE